MRYELEISKDSEGSVTAYFRRYGGPQDKSCGTLLGLGTDLDGDTRKAIAALRKDRSAARKGK